jgi:hypothetical protein
MRFGGHETFFVREGWLSKGLSLVIQNPDWLHSPFLADYLGVGRNMAKSILHWLVATGLCSKSEDAHDSSPSLVPTQLGAIINKRDPHLTHQATWWFLHINLVRDRQNAATWNWFFNSFPQNRFERATVITALERHEKLSANRPASIKTLERDVACFLATYAVDVPYVNRDPEEQIDSPFQDLRLIRHFRASGHFELNRRRKAIDPEVLLFALNSAQIEGKGKLVDIGFHALTKTENGPLQTLALTADALFEYLTEFESTGAAGKVIVTGLAGDRQIRFTKFPPDQVANEYFRRVGEHGRN